MCDWFIASLVAVDVCCHVPSGIILLAPPPWVILTVFPLAEFDPGGAVGSAVWTRIRVFTSPLAPAAELRAGTVCSFTIMPPEVLNRAPVGAGAVIMGPLVAGAS